MVKEAKVKVFVSDLMKILKLILKVYDTIERSKIYLVEHQSSSVEETQRHEKIDFEI